MTRHILQRTLQTATHATGVGLHTGERVELRINPAPVGTGIVFRRIDLPQPVDIAMQPLAVCDTRLASTLSHNGQKDGVKVNTVEHLMSACAGLGIDNLLIDINAEEVPIMDGSAASFVFLLQNAGIAEQNAPREFVRVIKPVEIVEGAPDGPNHKWARLAPFEGYALDFQIDFKHPAVDATGQTVSYDLSSQPYAQTIGRARTFGFTKDVEMMRANGLAMGGGLDNAIVLDDYKVLNDGGLRVDDEFARHKILDAMGDLYLLGKPLLARYSAFRSGHALNNQLLRVLINQPDAFETVTLVNDSHAPKGYAEIPKPW